MKRGKVSGGGGLLPSSLRVISSCIKTVSSNAGSVASSVRIAGASVAASIGAPPQPDDEKDQVLWTGFDKLETRQACFKHVLLIGYVNGFQIVDVEDANDFSVLVSKRDDAVTFLQMQPFPIIYDGNEGFRSSHPMVVVVGSETNSSGTLQTGRISTSTRETVSEMGNFILTPTIVRFYSLKSHSYVHSLRFRSAVYMVRCSPRVVAVALATQIYCVDALTLENRFSVLTYPLQGAPGSNIGYGPMAVGPRWLAYAASSPLLSTTIHLSPQKLTPSPGASPSTSPSNASFIARYAMESSKQLATGILNIGDMGYKTVSKICYDLLPDSSTGPLSSSPGRRNSRSLSSVHPTDADSAGMVAVKDVVSKEIICQFRAHDSPLSAICFDPSGTMLVTASVRGHNINVFRIMRGAVATSYSSCHYDGTTSHVHLYKLHRGLTSAVIQDFSFSAYSQWIAVVSSHGTCHIFTLSPFGGDASLQPQNVHIDGVPLAPDLSKPWWSKPSFSSDQKVYSHPPTITAAVVGRIKNISGWFSTVSSVAALASGKSATPSGAIAVVFHNSFPNGTKLIPTLDSSLQHLLVCSPSGHVIQYELVPAPGIETLGGSSAIVGGPSGQYSDDDLNISVEPIQWWDVCRRTNWPESEDTVPDLITRQSNNMASMNLSDSHDNEASHSPVSGHEYTKVNEQPNSYVSNAEVEINSARVPIWHNPKVSVCAIDPSAVPETPNGGEIQIETFPFHEVATRRPELVPHIEQFQFHQVDYSARTYDEGRYLSASLAGNQAKYDLTRGTSRISEDSEGQMLANNFESVGLKSPKKQFPPEASGSVISSEVYNENNSSLSTFGTKGLAPSIHQQEAVDQLHSSHTILTDHAILDGQLTRDEALRSSNTLTRIRSSSNEDFAAHIANERNKQYGNAGSHNSVEFTQFIQEGYCDISELDDCCDSAETVNDAISSSKHRKRDEPDEDADNDDIGGVFAFSDEG